MFMFFKRVHRVSLPVETEATPKPANTGRPAVMLVRGKYTAVGVSGLTSGARHHGSQVSTAPPKTCLTSVAA